MTDPVAFREKLKRYVRFLQYRNYSKKTIITYTKHIERFFLFSGLPENFTPA